MSEKTIALGLGDIFMTKLLFDSNNINDKIIANFSILNMFRNNTEDSKIFVKYLLDKLYKDNYKIVNDKNNCEIYSYVMDYKFSPEVNNLKKYFTLDPYVHNGEILENYIVIHTKARIDKFPLYKELKESLINFFSNYKSSCKIVIIGERYMSRNRETQECNIQCLYDEIINLKNNNNVLDLTENELYNTPKINTFERDIKILCHASKIFGFGWGGNFSMSWAVSSNFCFYVSVLEHPILNFFKNLYPNSIISKLDNFYDELNKFKL